MFPTSACCRIAVSLCLVFVCQAQAQSVWNTTTGNWSAGASWQPAVAPLSDSTTALIFGGSASYTATNDIGVFALNSLKFTNTAGTATIATSPATNALSLVNASTSLLPTISASGAGSVTISAPVNWDANTTVTNTGAGTLRFGGTQTYANGTKQTFTNAGLGTLVLADAITYANAGTNTGLVLNLINNNSNANTFDIGDMGALTNVTFNIGGPGIVRFAGSSADDLFSGSAVLNVASGSTFDLNGNGETMGAISGAGTLRAVNSGFTVASAGTYVFSGKLTGTAATLSVNGTTHTLVMSGSTSDYSGATSILAGRMIVSANAPSGTAGALGNATSDVLVGNTSGSGLATLLIDTAGVNIGRTVRLQSGNTGVMTLGGLNASGTATYSGNVILGTSSQAAKALTITSTAGGTVEFTGGIQRATSATGTTDAVTLIGNGTVAMRGTNTYTGATSISGGTLQLDYSTDNGSKLSSTAALTLNGGSLSITGNASAATTQAVGSFTLGNSSAPLGGGGRVTATTGTDQNAALSLGAITRNTGATVDFATTNSGTGVASITTTTPNNSANILGSYATFNRGGWAVNDGSGNITALAAGSYGTPFGSGLHTSLSANTALASGGATTNTLRLTSAAALTFNATTPGTLTLESGGILVATTAGTTSIGGTTTRGTIATSTGELIVHQHSTTGTLTINSVIGGTNLVKSGDGALTLTGTNTYTGATIINGGTVTATASANLGVATADVTINGGTLALPSGTLGTLNSTNRVITVGPAGATFNFAVNQSMEGSGLAGIGPLRLTGAGVISVGSTSSSFNGSITINAGSLKLASAQLNSVASITVNSGGTYHVEDDGTGTFSMAAAGRWVINGNGLGNNGAIRVSDQTPSSSRADPKTTLDREIVLQTTSRIQVDNGSATGSLSQLVLTGNVTGPGGLVKSGNGSLLLQARDNTYSGSTVVEAGTLILNLGNDRLPTTTSVTLGAGSTSGTLQLNGYSQTIAGLTTAGTGTTNSVIGGSATSTSLLNLNIASGSQTYAGTLGGTGINDIHANNNLGLLKSGAGSLTLNGSSTFNGVANVANGTLALGSSNALGGGGTSLAATNGGTIVQAGATLDLNGQTSIQEVITLNGTGVGGTGSLVNNTTTPASIGGGIASLSVPSVTTTGWSAGANVMIDGPILGTTATATAQLGLTAGSMTLLNGGSGFGLAPTITVTGGTGALVTATVGVTSASYTVAAFVPGTTSTYSAPPSVTLQNGATGVAVLDANGYVIGINITSPGTSFTSTPTATFTGGTTIFAGTTPAATGNNNNYTILGLNIVNAGTGFTSAPTITVTGGTGAAVAGNDGAFALNGFTITGAGSGYTSAPAVNISGGTATATANISNINLTSNSSIGGSGDITIQAPITGAFGLAKVGAGTVTLTSGSTYSGGTTVSAGTLQVGAGSNGSITGQVSATGTGFSTSTTVSGVNRLNQPVSNQIVITDAPAVAGTGMISGNVTIGTNLASAGILKPGDSGGTANGTLTVNGNLVVNNGSQIQLGLTSSTSNDPGFNPASTTAKTYLDGIYGGGSGSTYVQYWKTASGSYDSLQVTGTITLGSTGAGSNQPTILATDSAGIYNAGDIFKLLDWVNVSTSGSLLAGGTFDPDRDLVLPALSSGLAWDTTAFTTYGVAVVTSIVPEPGRATLLLMALGAMALKRRRSRP